MQVMPSTGYSDPVPQPLQAGIAIVMVPSSQAGFGIELQRTSDVGGGLPASSAANSIAVLPPRPAVAPYLDTLPLDGAKRFYRAREVEDGWTAGNWTAWTTGHAPVQLSVKDTFLSLQDLQVYPVLREVPLNDGQMTLAANDTGGVQPSSGLYMPSTQKIAVGTLAASSYVTKTLDADYSLFSVRAAQPLTFGNGFLSFTSSGIQTIGAPISISIPNRAMVQSATQLSALINFGSTQEITACSLFLKARWASDPTNVDTIKGNIINLAGTSAVGNWVEVNAVGGTTGLVTIGASSYASYEIQYVITSTNPTNSKLGRARLQYFMPTYDVTR